MEAGSESGDFNSSSIDEYLFGVGESSSDSSALLGGESVHFLLGVDHADSSAFDSSGEGSDVEWAEDADAGQREQVRTTRVHIYGARGVLSHISMSALIACCFGGLRRQLKTHSTACGWI